jgi:hypothetical protein
VYWLPVCDAAEILCQQVHAASDESLKENPVTHFNLDNARSLPWSDIVRTMTNLPSQLGLRSTVHAVPSREWLDTVRANPASTGFAVVDFLEASLLPTSKTPRPVLEMEVTKRLGVETERAIEQEVIIKYIEYACEVDA